jgi:hypothetical protein
MVGIIVIPALRRAVSGSVIGTLGLAGLYTSVTTGFFVLPSYLRVYQNGIISLIKSAFDRTAGKYVFIE